MMAKLFTTLFINTGIVVLLVNADFSYFGLNLGIFGSGQFYEPSASWYRSHSAFHHS
jgi:hypothetical protein